MAMLHPVRKACPACGKPMKAVPDEASEKRPRYVCTTCNDEAPATTPSTRLREADGFGAATECSSHQTAAV